jgi:hypothetical protein
MIDPKNDPVKLRQQPLDLQIEDVQAEAEVRFISPDEANRISDMARMALEELRPGGMAIEAPKWFEDYRRLRDVGWPWRVACYIAWAASPKKNRKPKGQEELATMFLGLTSDRQITTWRKKNPVIDETIALLQAAPLFEARRDAFEALIESASNPNYKGKGDRELLFKMLGDLVDKRELRLRGSVRTQGVAERSDEELRALLGEEEEDLNHKGTKGTKEEGSRGDAETRREEEEDFFEEEGED